MTLRLHGLVAATHTPFASDGTLDLSKVERQAGHLLADGVAAVFINGTTGESHSLTADERLALAQRWSEVARGTALKLVVHVGANAIGDSRAFAAQAQQLGAAAISAVAPSYFKPRTLDDLVACCAEVAAAAPGVPFYYYDIPPMTGVSFPMPAFLAAAAERVPTLAGVKFSNPDLAAYQGCLHAGGGRFDVPWGIDEYLLAALAVGAKGGVGSTYNFASPLYHRLIAAFEKGDLATAREEQYLSVRLVNLLSGFGYMAAAKATMGFLGVEVGSARLPNGNLDAAQRDRLRAGLEELGFFDRVRG
jgi:N-acetylneuraminate lyase